MAHPPGVAQNSNQTVYVPCSTLASDAYQCATDCGNGTVIAGSAGGAGNMDLIDPPECDSSVQACAMPTHDDGFYGAVTDTSWNCSGTFSGCDSSDPYAPLCPAGSTCSTTSGPGMCVPTQTGGVCTPLGYNCVEGSLTGCCQGVCTPGTNGAPSTCQLPPIPPSGGGGGDGHEGWNTIGHEPQKP